MKNRVVARLFCITIMKKLGSVCAELPKTETLLRGEILTKHLVLATERKTPNPSFGWAEQA